MKARLLVIGPNNRTTSHIVYQPSIRLGSSSDCEVPIPPDVSPVVSRQHALIDITDDGIFITDMGSTNGTYVNGQRLAERTLLHPADEVRLGQKGPIIRAFLIGEAGESEGTLLESTQSRQAAAVAPPAAPKVGLPPPPPLPLTRTDLPPKPPARNRTQPPTPADEGSIADYSRGRPSPRAKGKSQHIYYWAGGGGLLVAVVVTLLVWKPWSKSAQKDPNAPMSSEEIFNRTVASSTFIEVDLGGGLGATGSGSLIDKDRRLVLTAYHVIDGASPNGITVTFAKYRDGKLLSSKSDYGQADRVKAKVWKSAKDKDLAILQIDSVPAEAKPLPLASDSPKPGEDVHTVGGSPRESIGLWIYSKGSVREVQKDRFPIETGYVNAWVIRTTNPINQGDSGGALVNKNCELVGVCSADIGKRTNLKTGKTEVTADLVRAFIDVREVKELLGVVSSPPATNTGPTTPGPIDPKKLVGKWKPPSEPGQIEFMADGKLVLSGPAGKLDGRYQVNGNKLTITLNVGGKEDTDTMTIKTLTDDRLVTIDEMGKEEELRRVK